MPKSSFSRSADRTWLKFGVLLFVGGVAGGLGFLFGQRQSAPDFESPLVVPSSREPGSLQQGFDLDPERGELLTTSWVEPQGLRSSPDSEKDSEKDANKNSNGSVIYQLRARKPMSSREFADQVVDCPVRAEGFETRSLFVFEINTAGKPTRIESIERVEKPIPSDLWQCRFKPHAHPYLTIFDNGLHVRR
jgi:hypothetical protein